MKTKKTIVKFHYFHPLVAGIVCLFGGFFIIGCAAMDPNFKEVTPFIKGYKNNAGQTIRCTRNNVPKNHCAGTFDTRGRIVIDPGSTKVASWRVDLLEYDLDGGRIKDRRVVCTKHPDSSNDAIEIKCNRLKSGTWYKAILQSKAWFSDDKKPPKFDQVFFQTN